MSTLPLNSDSPLTAEAISRTYDSSIVLRRWIGAWIDFLILALIFILPDVIGRFMGNDFYQKTLFIWVTIALVYFPLTEGFAGCSLGKLIAGIRVVNSSGHVPGLFAAILRTLARVIEVNPFLAGGIPAGVVVLVSKKRQRLGDMLAGTFVLKKEDLVRLRAPTSTST